MKKSLIVLCALGIFITGLAGSAFGGGEFTSANCQLTLIQHTAYTDKSTWKFNGTCGGSATFVLSGMWKQSEKKAYESISGTGSTSVTGSIVSVCPMGIDPWLNAALCAPQAQQGNFLTYFKEDASTNYPLSGRSLSAGQRAQFLAEAQANGHSPASTTPPPPPPPPGSDHKVLTQRPQQAAIVQLTPKIVSPVSGTSYHNNVPVQVTPPPTSTAKKVKLEFQFLQNGGWVTKAVVAEYDTATYPSGISIPKNQFPDKGDWRVKAKMASPFNAPWSQPVPFRLQ